MFSEQEKSRKVKLAKDWRNIEPAEDSYDQRQRLRGTEDSVSQLIHTNAGNYRNDTSIVSHITQIATDQERERAKSNVFGLNHILRAEQVEEENKKLAEQRAQGNGAKDLAK